MNLVRTRHCSDTPLSLTAGGRPIQVSDTLGVVVRQPTYALTTTTFKPVRWLAV